MYWLCIISVYKFSLHYEVVAVIIKAGCVVGLALSLFSRSLGQDGTGCRFRPSIWLYAEEGARGTNANKSSQLPQYSERSLKHQLPLLPTADFSQEPLCSCKVGGFGNDIPLSSLSVLALKEMRSWITVNTISNINNGNHPTTWTPEHLPLLKRPCFRSLVAWIIMNSNYNR